MGEKRWKVNDFSIDNVRSIPYNIKAMWLDLRDIIEVPGASKPFETTLDPEQLLTPSICAFTAPLAVSGRVVNTAGLLELKAEIPARMRCVCDRCGTQFDREKVLPVNATLSADMEDEDEADVFPVEGDGIDVNEVLETCFILDEETKCLCRPDCRGLCPTCGKNLNDGPCDCTKPVDPRFAVLEQLLDK